jgi:hypothetical protein
MVCSVDRAWCLALWCVTIMARTLYGMHPLWIVPVGMLYGA